MAATDDITRTGGTGDDRVLSFRTLASRAQGRVVRLGAAVDDILTQHAYPEPVSHTLGEAIALTAMLGSLLHADGRLILQTKTDGPLHMLVVDYRKHPSQEVGNIRAMASFDASLLGRSGAGADASRFVAAKAAGKLDQAHLIGSGHLAMTIDSGRQEPRTQGIVALANHALSDAALTYFRHSEQIPTFVRLAVARHSLRGADGAHKWHWRAGGLILQQLPEDVGHDEGAPHGKPRRGGIVGTEADDDRLVGDRGEDWQRAHMLAATVEDHELLDPTLTPEQLLYRLFHEEGVRVATPVAVRAHCGCTRDRVQLLLKGFGAAEISDMREPDGGVTVTCEYCSTKYRFTSEDLGRL